MAQKRQFDVMPFVSDTHRAGVLKLWAAVGSFDGSVPPRSPEHLDALLAHESSERGAPWRVALAPNGAVVGVMIVRFLGTKRTQLEIAVNPAWRRQGVGTKLLGELPPNKRLLTTSRVSVDAASDFLKARGFSERHRDARLRAPRFTVEDPDLPKWAGIEEDESRDPQRFAKVAEVALTEEDAFDGGVADALLGRPGTRVFYLKTPDGDQGVCLVTGLDRSKKSERKADGTPTVGLLEQVGLARACRGKGLSRPLVRVGLRALFDDGYESFEVVSDGRRPQGQKLYEREGFTAHDEDIHWLRRDDE